MQLAYRPLMHSKPKIIVGFVVIFASMIMYQPALAESDADLAAANESNSIKQMTLEIIKTRKQLEDISIKLGDAATFAPQLMNVLQSLQTSAIKLALIATERGEKPNLIVLTAVAHQEKSESELCSVVLKNEKWKTLGVVDFRPSTDQHLDPSTGAVTQKRSGFAAQIICAI